MKDYGEISERLAARRLRPTAQRQVVYRVLLEERDHPTAEKVFLRAKKEMPEISMATVYNCLDALVRFRLVREVNVDRTAMRYCPNMEEHWHFRCERCGAIYDIDLPAIQARPETRLPEGFEVTTYEVSVHGVCPTCYWAKGLRVPKSVISNQ